MTRKRILLLRSGGIEGGEEKPPAGVDLLVTHEVLPVPHGIAEAIAFEAQGAALIVTSRSTVRVLHEEKEDFFRAPFSRLVSAGEGTARALREAGAPDVTVPGRPGAAGIVELLANAVGLRILWPHGSDADTASFEGLAAKGSTLKAPIVYLKHPIPRPDPARIEAFLRGAYAGVAVSSLAALDVFLEAARAPGRALPQVRWGAIGPGTARAFAERHLPPPVVPSRARVNDLVDALAGVLREEKK